MRPSPTMPTVFSNSSMPVYLLRFHSPRVSAACAGLMWRAAASIRATASSAALTMLEVGALTTITPFWVAALTSTLSSPTPARATTLSRLAACKRLLVDLGGRAHQERVDVDDRGEQLGPVGAVAVPDLEVGTEGLHGCGAELFGDEYDGPGFGLGRGGERHEWSSQEGVGAWPEGQRSSTTLCRRSAHYLLRILRGGVASRTVDQPDPVRPEK